MSRYILFVTASKDGTVVVYRCYRTEQMQVSGQSQQKRHVWGGGRRTEMEIAMLAAEDFRGDNVRDLEYCRLCRCTGKLQPCSDLQRLSVQDRNPMPGCATTRPLQHRCR